MLMLVGNHLHADGIKKFIEKGQGKNIKEALLDYFKDDKDVVQAIKSEVNRTKKFPAIVSEDNDELPVILELVTKIKFVGFQSIVIRLHDMSYDYLYERICNIDDEILEHILLKIDYNDIISIAEFKQFYLKLQETKKVIPNDATQLEKISHIYDIVKQREYNYKEEHKHTLIPRLLSKTWLNGEIVCVGYTKIFNMLLREYDIPCTEYVVYYDNLGGHMKSIVNVDDEKYDVHGLYFFDPTWDSYVKNDKFNECKYKYFLEPLSQEKELNIIDDSLSTTIFTQNSSELCDLLKQIINYGDKYLDELIFNYMQMDYDLFKGELTSPLHYTEQRNEAIRLLFDVINIFKSEFSNQIEKEKFADLLDYIYKDDLLRQQLSAISKYGTTIEKSKKRND